MATATHLHSTAPLRQEARHPLRVACPVTAREGNVAQGLGGHSIAGIVMEHCGDQPVPLGVIVEYLDAQVGVWQYSLDDGETWRTLADLLLLFIYLEVLAMVSMYLKAGKLPIRIPIYIAIVALARYLILDMKEMDTWRLLGVGGTALLLTLTVFLIRYGHYRFPYQQDE